MSEVRLRLTMEHNPTCSRVRGAFPLPAYVYVVSGRCAECFAIVAVPRPLPVKQL